MLDLLSNGASIIIAVIGFSILVFFHELGHFLVAKLFKIKVETFSVGMGPAIVGFRRGDTYYQIGAVPFGGFCKFKGEEIADDLPARFSMKIYQDILEKIKDEGNKEVLINSFKKNIPDKIRKEEFENLFSSIRGNVDVELMKRAYTYDDDLRAYYLIDDLTDENEDRIYRIIEENNKDLLFYSIKSGIDEKVKKKITKIISSVKKIYTLRDRDSFYGAPPAKRLAVAFFGPFMNYIIAIIFLSLLAMGTHKELYYPAKIMLVDDDFTSANKKESPAKKGGLKSGDIIKKIDGVEVSTFQDISLQVYDKKGPLDITLERDGMFLNKTINPEWDPEQLKYIIGIFSYLEPIIDDNPKNILQKELGLKKGDIIVGIDGKYENWSITNVMLFLTNNFSSAKKSVLHVKRDDKIIDIPIVFNEINHRVSQKDFYLNFYYPERIIEGKGFGRAFISGFKEANGIIKMTVVGLYSLIFKPKKNVRNQVGGPIMIGYFIGNATVAGFKESFYAGVRQFFSIISYISLALAFFNLLPIPALDGGYIIMNLYEIVARRSISMKLVYRLVMIFFTILITLSIFVTFMDISKIANGFK